MKIYTIGRGETNTIHVENEFVSRQHALLKVYPTGKMELIDKSSNGTSINGRKLKPNVAYRVRRKDVVTFAGQAKLDWSEVKDPMKGYRIAGLCLLIAAVLLGGFFIAKPYLFKTSGDSYGGGGGGGYVPPTEQPADTAKKAEGGGGVNVSEELKKMTEAEKRKKAARKKKEAEAKKKAEETKKGESAPADTTAPGMKLGL